MSWLVFLRVQLAAANQHAAATVLLRSSGFSVCRLEFQSEQHGRQLPMHLPVKSMTPRVCAGWSYSRFKHDGATQHAAAAVLLPSSGFRVAGEGFQSQQHPLRLPHLFTCQQRDAACLCADWPHFVLRASRCHAAAAVLLLSCVTLQHSNLGVFFHYSTI
jgi:hypothetical protein